MKSKTVLIGGSGRCGTTITKKVLSEHSEIATLPFEYRFTIDPDGIVDFYRSYASLWSPYQANKQIKRLENLFEDLQKSGFWRNLLDSLIKNIPFLSVRVSPSRYAEWELDRYIPNFESHVKELIEELRSFSYKGEWVGTESYTLNPEFEFAPPRHKEEIAEILGDFLQDVIFEIVNKENAKIYAEDNTWNVLYAKDLLELVPEGKVIHVLREPRDVVASLSNQRWGPEDRIDAANWYKAFMERWFELKVNLKEEDYFEVKLESIVTSPSKTMREICDFIGLEYEESLLDVDLSKSHSGRWREEFTSQEKTRVTEILGGVIENLGY